MDHLPVTDIYSRMGWTDGNISGLRISHRRPFHKVVGRSDASIRTRQAVTYKSRAIECIRTGCSPYI